MGAFNFMKNKAKEKVKNKAKNMVKAKLATLGLALAIKIIPILLVVVTAVSIVDWVVELFTAENTPEEIYNQLEIEDVAELIQIKENNGGYYLDFIDGIDEKLDALIETINTSGEYHNVPKDKKFLKKLIQAEVVTKFPDLGGTPPKGSSGFQGVIDIKRVTPNKKVGEMKNTGKDDTNVLEPESSYNDSQITPKEEHIKTWKEGKKIEIYSDAYVYEKVKGKWIQKEYENSKTKIKLKKSSDITYKGKYEVSEDKLNKTTIIYVEIKGKDTKGKEVEGYIRSSNINLRMTDESEEEKKDDKEESSKDKEDKEENSKDKEDKENKKEDSKKDKDKKTSSRAKDKEEKIVVGNKDKKYTVAIAAGHNNVDDKGASSGDLIEEELTIKVAEKVEELVNERYKNVKVVQTGSTSSNPGGIKVEDRTKLARDAKPDLCIQIHFNAAESPDAKGVEAIYKDGDGISQQLAEILSKTISQEMELEDRKAGTDLEKCAVGSLGIIENAAHTKFPSVVTEGGFLTNTVDAEVIRNGGTDKYAEGIVKGIKEYLEADHSGYSSYAPGETVETASIESKIMNMKYLPLEEFNKLKEKSVEEAIKYFSLNEDNKLITLSWSRKGDGSIEIKENPPMDFRTALQKYTMPYEYLLYYYFDTGYRKFSEELADIVINSEIVIALQDNVTTTHTVVEIQQKVVAGENSPKGSSKDWNSIGTQSDEITENCSTKIDITYIETWCVKVYKDNSYSRKVLNMEDKEEIIVNVPGKVTEIKDQATLGNEVIVESGNKETGKKDSNGNPITYSYDILNRTLTTSDSIRNTYDTTGDMKVEELTNKYVNLYIKEKMNDRLKEEFFFDILENNEKTANLLDLTKYLMFLASNTDYGVTEFDFEDMFRFNNINGSGSQMGLLIEYIHYWEHSSPPPTSADGTKYIIENDGAGNAVVGYGVDIFNGGFAEEFRQAGYPTNIGGEVDKEFVDNLEKREIQECMDSIKSLTSGLNLTGYQLNALVSRAYNCGVGGAVTTNRGSPPMNFVDSYNSYWKESDDQFEAKNTNANFSHSLYTQYMAKPVTAINYGYMPGLERRRKSEWTLFQTGYYDVLDKWHSEGGMGGTIIECAKAIHEYMEANNYTYCVYGGNSYEECGTFGKAHGLNRTFEESKTGYTNTCCATYVSWVLQEAGYITPEEHTDNADALSSLLIQKGFTVITDASQLQPGDILSYSGHIEIYAGDGTVYNAGSGNAIRSASPQTKSIASMNMGLRAPN